MNGEGAFGGGDGCGGSLEEEVVQGCNFISEVIISNIIAITLDVLERLMAEVLVSVELVGSHGLVGGNLKRKILSGLTTISNRLIVSLPFLNVSPL